jgi:hypothetical protein
VLWLLLLLCLQHMLQQLRRGHLLLWVLLCVQH